MRRRREEFWGEESKRKKVRIKKEGGCVMWKKGSGLEGN
jgi:hypothetical protein